MATTRIMLLHVGALGRTESRAISDIIDHAGQSKENNRDNGRLITGQVRVLEPDCGCRVSFFLAKWQYIAATGRVRVVSLMM